MSTEPTEVTPVQAVAALAVRNGRVLLIRSRKHGIALPAGKVQPDESHEAALRREVREETGLEVVRVLRFLCTETEAAYHCHHYEVEVADGEPVASTDAEAAWWAEPAEAAQSAFPMVRELVAVALDRAVGREVPVSDELHEVPEAEAEARAETIIRAAWAELRAIDPTCDCVVLHAARVLVALALDERVILADDASAAIDLVDFLARAQEVRRYAYGLSRNVVDGPADPRAVRSGRLVGLVSVNFAGRSMPVDEAMAMLNPDESQEAPDAN